MKCGQIPLLLAILLLGNQNQASKKTNAVKEINFARGSASDSQILSKVLLLTSNARIHIIAIGDEAQTPKTFNATFKSRAGSKLNLDFDEKAGLKMATHFKNGQVLYLAHQKSVFVCENCFVEEDSVQDKQFKQIATFTSDIISMKIVRNKMSIVLGDGRILGVDLSNRKLHSDMLLECKQITLIKEIGNNLDFDIKMAFEYFESTLYTVNAKNELLAWSQAPDKPDHFQNPVRVTKWSQKIEDITILPTSGKMYISTRNSISELDLVNSKIARHEKCSKTRAQHYSAIQIGNQVQFHWIEEQAQIFTSNVQCEAVKKEKKQDTYKTGKIIGMIAFQQFIVSDEFIIKNEPAISMMLGVSLKAFILIIFVCCAIPLVLMILVQIRRLAGSQHGRAAVEKIQMVRSSMNNSGYYKQVMSVTGGARKKYGTKSNSETRVMEL